MPRLAVSCCCLLLLLRMYTAPAGAVVVVLIRAGAQQVRMYTTQRYVGRRRAASPPNGDSIWDCSLCNGCRWIERTLDNHSVQQICAVRYIEGATGCCAVRLFYWTFAATGCDGYRSSIRSRTLLENMRPSRDSTQHHKVTHHQF